MKMTDYMTEAERQQMIRELRDGIASKKRQLADCAERRPTLELRKISDAWAGTPNIDFESVASVIRYSLEEDIQNLDRAERNQGPMLFVKEEN